MALYEIVLVVIGLAILGAVVLPRLLSNKPVSFPILYVIVGMILFSLPLGFSRPDPVGNPAVTEHITELVVIVALMGAGLKLDRPFDWRAWIPTWRLLGITMPLTITAVALLSWVVLDIHPATAVLLGAVVAPTDPVLAGDVEATPPTDETDTDADPKDQEGSIRFALTSEAGLNDGLAFPFTNLAIAMAAAAGAASVEMELPVMGEIHLFGDYGWLAEWFLVDVAYQITVGVVVGYAVGKAIAIFIFGRPSSTELARVMEGAEALAATLIAYGIAELLHGYGFLAVFVGALTLRHFEWQHDYYEELHDFAVITERMLMAAVLVMFGGALATGLLAPLGWVEGVLAVSVVLVIRPLAGAAGMLGAPGSWYEQAVIASFGIRGIGSFYYLSHALNQATFQESEFLTASDKIWAFVGLIVLSSIAVHGVTSSAVMDRLDRWRDEEAPATPPTAGESTD